MPKRNLIWILAVVAASLVTLLITRSQPRPGTVPPGEFDPVSEAYRTIREHYLYPLDENELRRGAIGGMVSRLDEYSTYIPPSRAQAFADRMAGLAWGSGLKVEARGEEVVVVGPLAGSPAQNGPALRGDRILEIDCREASHLSQAGVEELLEDSPAASIRLLVLRADGKKEVLRCSRGKFPVESVQGLYRSSLGEWVYRIDPEGGVAYVRVREILPDTPESLRSALRQLEHVRSLIVDLRDNPGGDLLAAVDLANLLIPRGPIVTVVDRRGRTEHVASAAHQALGEQVRVVALIDENTASAAEIVAGALRYRDRGALVGQRTRGKGCVQSMIPLEGGLGRLNLTTAEFFVDPQRPIQRQKDSNAWGVDPHVEVELPAPLGSRLRVLRVRAEVLPPARPTTRSASTRATAEEADTGRLLLQLDPQLNQAIALANDPARIDDLLRRAARLREEARTRPATTRPAAPSGAPP